MRFRAKVLIGLVVAIISSFPYIWGFATQKDDLIFLGRSVLNSADTYIYLSHIESVRDGNLILPNLYSTESKSPFAIKPIFIPLGLLARVFDLDSLATYHLGRFLLSVVFVVVLLNFVQIFVSRPLHQFITLVIVLFSSGIGFLVKEILPDSIDLWVPEANTFLMLLESPHFISTQIILILAIYLIFKFLSKPDFRYLMLASFCSSIVVFEHPYMIPFIFSFPVILLFSKFGFTLSGLNYVFFYLTLPIISSAIVYAIYLVSPSAKLINVQTVLKTPLIISVISGYGFLLLFSSIAVYSKLLRRFEYKALLIWIVLTFILIYIPFSFQRRLLESLHIPIAILAAVGIVKIYNLVNKSLTRAVIVTAILVLLSLTSIYNSAKIISAYNSDTPTEYVHHINKKELLAMEWLDDLAGSNEVILANFFYSNILPGITGSYVYNGHLLQTFKSREKLIIFDNFMENFDSDERLKFLHTNNIDYIFIGKNDPYRDFIDSLVSEEFLEIIWDKNDVTIFKVLEKPA